MTDKNPSFSLLLLLLLLLPTTLAIIQHPNATGSVSFLGPNLTPSSNSGQWTWTIQVGETKPSNTSIITIEESLSLSWSAETKLDSPGAWDVCVTVIRGLPRNVTGAAQEDSGDCGKTFSEECIDALKDSKNVAGPSGVPDAVCGGYTIDKVPDVCTPYFPSTLSGPSFGGSFTSTETLSHSFPNASEYSSYSQSTNDSSAGMENYQSALRDITPILVRPYVNSNGSSSVGEARLACVRPTIVEEGSVPKEVDGTTTGAGSGQQPEKNESMIGRAGWSREMLSVVVAVAGLLVL